MDLIGKDYSIKKYWHPSFLKKKEIMINLIVNLKTNVVKKLKRDMIHIPQGKIFLNYLKDILMLIMI